MRILLIIMTMLEIFSIEMSAQDDFVKLDRQTYDYYLKGDYKNLSCTAERMISQGIDYYYLRMRLGILSYNKQLYYNALKHFNKALEFNSLDTVSRKYIYYSYLFSGRKADANLYLKSVSGALDNNKSRLKERYQSQEFYAATTVSYSNISLYRINNLYYEAIKNSLNINAGFESYFLKRFKGTFSYTNFRKSGTVYSASFPDGKDLNFSQDQVYVKLTGYIFPGWEFSGFSQFAFFNDILINGQKTTEYLGGAGISKNGWKIRTGVNISLSNFSNSTQTRAEGYVTWLPGGNLNLYFTSGGMYQSDKTWGNTYQINQDVGFRINKSLWMESGINVGNSFLYARNQGFMMNNSFLIPATTIYGNIICFLNKNFSISLTPFYIEYQSYSWDLDAFTRTGKLINNSLGGSIKLKYKYR